MTTFTHSLAVLIGIDAYSSGIPRLTTAVNDATRLAELLAAQHGYETILLTEPAAGEPMTLAQLRDVFQKELPARLGADDRLLVYFAGHGVALDGDDGPRGYLAPQDARPGDSASMLAMTDLHAWLTALPCRHMLAILDCCFAGAFRWASTRHLGALPDVLYKERYDRYLISPAWQVLTSAAFDQTALDVLAGDVKRGTRAGDDGLHSPFALALFAALTTGDADLIPKGQGDGVITATELYLYLREQVEIQAEEQASHEQTPGLWPLNKHRKGEFIFLAPGHPLNLPPAPDLTAEANPYRGLKSYDQKHAPLFFGREDEIKELVQQVDRQPFVAVLGASGTGKSSLVKAGLLPRLEVRSDDFSRPVPAEATEVATTNEVYRVLAPMRPTDRPVQALEALLRAELGADLTGLRPDLSALEDLTGLSVVIARWTAAQPGRRLVLTIDQFEELATLCRDDDERARFLRLLAAAIEQQPDAFRLIVTLRTDFEPQFTQEGSPLAEAWKSARYVVPPMDIEDLRQVIEGPAAVRVLYFDPPELTDDLIKEVIQTPGALPLLSFTLSELYIKYVRSGRDDRALSSADYKALGGVVGSLRNRATEEYDALPDDAHRRTMQRVMLRMVAAEGGELARRRVALSELEYPTAEENARVRTVLDRLVDARLLVRGTADQPDGAQGEAYVEPAHDALVLAWDKLLRWKKEAEEYLPLQRRLAQAAGEWCQAQPTARSGLLWDDDPRLPQVEETLWPTGGKQKGLRGRGRWVRQVLAPKIDAPPDTKWLNGVELAFVQDSVRTRTRFWRRAVSITSLIALALTVVTIFALAQRNDANAQRDIAVTAQSEAEREARRSKANELAAHTQNAIGDNPNDPSLALLLAIEAVQATWRAPEQLVTASSDIALRHALDVAPPYLMSLPRHRHSSAINSVTFSPDSTAVVTASDDQTARIWDVTTGQQVQMLDGHTAGVNSAVYSRDGQQIVTASEDGTVRIWDAITAQQVRVLSGHECDELGDCSILSASFSPDSRMIVSTGADHTARIWDAATGQEIRQLKGHTNHVLSATFSPDGKLIVTTSSDGTTGVWDATTGQRQHQIEVVGSQVTSATFSPNGRYLVTVECSYPDILAARRLYCDKSLAYTWDVATGQELHQLSDDSMILSAAYSPDGAQVLTAGCTELTIGDPGLSVVKSFTCGRTAIVTWDAVTGKILRQVSTFGGLVSSAAYSPNGKLIVTTVANQTVYMWDAESGHEVRRFGGVDCEWGGCDVTSAAYSPDGMEIITQRDDMTYIWDATTGQEVRHFTDKVPSTHMTEIAFSPDGKEKATIDNAGGAVSVRNLATGQILRRLTGHTGAIRSVTYSPNGAYILTVSDDQTARIWDAATGQEVTQLRGHAASIHSATYSPDGGTIVTAGCDRRGATAMVFDTCLVGSARLWESTKRKEIFRHNDGVGPLFSAAYTPDSKTIMTIGEDGVIHFWDVATRQEARQPLQYGDELDPFFPMALSPDGKQGLVRTPYIPLSETYFHAWDVPIWNATSEFSNSRTSLRIKGDFSSATFSPDGKQIATVVCVETRIESGFDRICTSPYVGIWEETPLQEVRQLHGHTDWIRSAAFSPDGQRIVTASDDRTARIWDVATGQEVIRLSGHTAGVWSAAFSPDSRFIVTASKDRTARIWDANTGKVLQTLSGHSGTVLSAAFSPDGKYIVTASTDQTARVWDAATGQEVRTLNGHTDWVLSAIYRPDGQEILTVSADKTARTWSNIDDLLEEAKRLVQRDPPLLTPEERRQYGLE